MTTLACAPEAAETDWRCHPATSVLFLQGPPSPFARELGAELAARGLGVLRVNLCIGDWLFWHDDRAVSYRGSFAGWEAWLERLVVARQVSDIVYFADQMPYHRVAQRVARRHGIRAISYEYGYLRPDWIVVEPGGQSWQSHFPTDLARIRARAAALPAPLLAQLFRHDGRAEANGDVVYHLANYLLWFFWPLYRRDRMYNPLVEYLSYPLRFRRARRARSAAEAAVERLIRSPRPFFVVPLQMQNDYQIRANAPWTDQRHFLDTVLESFAVSADPTARLVVKMHPLDNGLENWARHLRRTVARVGLAERVVLLDGGDLERLSAHAAGMVVINSTCGVTALRLGCPVKVLGCATYDIRGLTHRGGLGMFWRAPFQPSRADVVAFLKVMAHDVHVRGDFYGPEGREAAVRQIADRLQTGRVWTGLFDPEPPRREIARRMRLAVDQ